MNIASAAPVTSTERPPPPRAAELARAARELEALFSRHLLAQVGSSLPGTSGGPGASVYASLLQDALASAAAERGAFGIANTLREHLQRAPGAAPHAQ
jgi:Rod binding domain-containing protein